MRVVVGEDSVLLRRGIVRVLEDAGFEVVAECGDGEDTLRKVRAHDPDLAVIDIRMPPTHTDEGLRVAIAIRAERLRTRVLVLSAHVDEDSALALLGAGTDGVGYLLKDRVADVDGFVEAARRVAGGGSALDPEVVAHLLGRRREPGPMDTLTPREHQVLAMMAEGRTNAAITGRLVITERSVEKHVTAIFSKLELAPAATDHRRVLAVLAHLERA